MTWMPAPQSMLLAACALAFCLPSPLWAQRPSNSVGEKSSSGQTAASHREGRWHVVKTANFFVCAADAESAARRTGALAELLRTQLAHQWFGGAMEQTWSPRCQIVLHGSRSGYTAAVGRGSEGTLGSSAVTFDGGRIIKRRIDLLATDETYLTNALPHELTHVLLRDRFTAGRLPRWADEAMAMMADPAAKQGRHIHDLRAAVTRSAEFSAADLLTMQGYPPADRRQAFYGQSIFVARLLIARKNSQHFVMFLERASAVGCEAALRECYGISGSADLDRLWRRNLYNGQLAWAGEQ